ncbi:MAG: GatB/YqeY domain-containing protein, partial [Pseudomonadota bacterium]
MADTLRDQFAHGLKDAMKARNKTAVSTLRLILAALKDRDVAARTKGQLDGINETEILAMLQSMIKQRQESISLY